MTTFDERIADVKIEIDKHVYRAGDILTIDETDLSEAFSTQAARLAYMGMIEAELENAYEKAKREREILYAELDLYYRDQLPKEGIKVTVDSVKAAVTLDEEYITAQKYESDIKLEFRKMKAVRFGMAERGQMLISFGALYRQEREQTDMRISEAKEKLRGNTK